MSDTEGMGLKDAAREINRFKKFLEAAEAVSDVLSAAVVAETEMVRNKKLADELAAECESLAGKMAGLQEEMLKKRAAHKAALDAAEKDASDRKREWRRQAEEAKARSVAAITKLEKELADRQAVLKRERQEIEAAATAMRKSVTEDIDQLEKQRANAERTIEGLRTRLSGAGA
jgi:hypothetical protein